MKKIIIILVFFFNIFPCFKNGNFTIFQQSKCYAQYSGTGLVYLSSYLASIHGSNMITVVGNYVRVSNGNGGFTLHPLTDYLISQDFINYMNTHYPNGALIPSKPRDPSNNGENPDGFGEEWITIELENNRYDFLADLDWFYTGINYGGEGNNGGPNNQIFCDPSLANIIETFDYFDVDASRVEDDVTGSGNSNLPCGNSFLLGNKVIHFSSAQQNGISNYNHNGSTLTSVIIGGKKYNNVTTYSGIKRQQRAMYVDNACPEYIEFDATFGDPKIELKFVDFAKLDSAIAASPNGVFNDSITSEFGKFSNGRYGFGYKKLPINLPGFIFSIHSSNIQNADSGMMVRAKTRAGVEFCQILTPEDIDRSNLKNRDPDFITDSLHIQHEINLPKWVRDFIDKISPGASQCEIDYMNKGLDSLHNQLEYITADETTKCMLEYKSMAYDAIFGSLYCASDENSAKNLPCADQIARGVMHELVSSIDVAQIRDGIVKLVKYGINTLTQNVKDMINGIEAVARVRYQTNTANLQHFEQIATEFAQKNITDINNAYATATTIAENFKNMYFTGCGNEQFPDGSTADMCCYRRAQLTMMMVPIVLTGGEYAVVKLTTLASKFGVAAKKAAEIIKNVLGNKSILTELDNVLNTNKTVIRETNATADVFVTIKKEEEILDGTNTLDTKIVITEAANVIDPNTLDNLTSIIPSTGGNLSKSKFHTNAHPIDKDITPDLKTRAENVINNINPAGNTEEIGDILFRDKAGFIKKDGKYGGGSDNGIDGLYIEGTEQNPTKIIINECKQWDGNGGVKMNPANPNSGLPVQMSDNWIQYVSGKIRNEALALPNGPTRDAKLAIVNMLENPANFSKIQKYVTVVNKKTGDINILKLGTY